MNILVVVQAYGLEVSGGAELHCRLVCEQLSAKGHNVKVLTSCSRSYVDWSNYYPPGDQDVNGVSVYRLPVRTIRHPVLFPPYGRRVVEGFKPVPLYMQEEWIRMQGPEVLGTEEWLEANMDSFDVSLVFTYLYYPGHMAIRTLAGRKPVVFQPLAHDEPYLQLPIFRELMNLVDGMIFNTEEERDLVKRLCRVNKPSTVIGVGSDLEIPGNGERFRDTYNVKDPYLLYVGRVDPNKGSVELYEFFLTYKRRNKGNLKLVIVGENVGNLPSHRGIVFTGFVSEQEKFDAIAGALALVVPSYFESFSMVLTEAWSQGTPTIVQGHCDVLVGQCQRSGGGLPYFNYAEFEQIVDMYRKDGDLTRALGERGRQYVEQKYRWSTVTESYEEALRAVVNDYLSPAI